MRSITYFFKREIKEKKGNSIINRSTKVGKEDEDK